jgi:hypothetical protein
MAKASFNKKKDLFTRQLDLNLRKKLAKSYISNIAFYGNETWTFRKEDQKYLEILKCGAGERRRTFGPIV